MKFLKKIAGVVLSLNVVFPTITMFKSNCVEAHFTQEELCTFNHQFLEALSNIDQMFVFCRDAYNEILEKQNSDDNNNEDIERLKILTKWGILGLYGIWVTYVISDPNDLTLELMIQRIHEIFDDEGSQLLCQPLNSNSSSIAADLHPNNFFPHCTLSRNGISVSELFHSYQQLNNYDEVITSVFNDFSTTTNALVALAAMQQ